jgi:hypothetical protein
MPKPRLAEVNAVTRLLDQEHEDLKVLAVDIIQTIDELRQERLTYGLLFAEGDTLICVSPFFSTKEMSTWAKKNDLAPAHLSRVVIKHPEDV